MSASDWQQVELWVAQWFAGRGWPSCERRGRGFAGRELVGMPGLAPEVKSRRKVRLEEWLRQALRNPDGGVPFVVHKPDGYGRASMAAWPMTLPLAYGTALLLDAGFGTRPELWPDEYPDLLAQWRVTQHG